VILLGYAAARYKKLCSMVAADFMLHHSYPQVLLTGRSVWLLHEY